ncbi:MAG TPA: ROK family transcriptional regulator [Pyrinomonadaceae bacterium]|jgi:predicted NBD/HSP70 family sugar kinase|nr:ROK family transcriptional regulator [Pyrinomonadaceae bacterium]
MRKINTHDFRVATRSTAREINQRIALNLIREHQPVSRADLARQLRMTRGSVTILVQHLIAQGLIYEGATGEAARGRKPTFLHLRTRDRLAIAVDIRFSKTMLVLYDFSGKQLETEAFDTIFSVPEFIRDLSARIRKLLKRGEIQNNCEGVGVAVPGMVDQRTGLVLYAPTLGWRQVELRERLGAATGLPVHIENSGRACALAQLWLERGDATSPNSFIYVSVSDGVGIGMVANGELVRGHYHSAGEFAHMPLNLDGPHCLCGASGCWEAYISNLATLSRYFGWNLSRLSPNHLRDSKLSSFSVLDLVGRAKGGDVRAIAALQSTGRFLGLGLGTIIKIVDPDCIYLGGEITAAWDLIETTVREALGERALTENAALTPLRVTSLQDSPRLRGAAALIAAPNFAAPRVA